AGAVRSYAISSASGGPWGTDRAQRPCRASRATAIAITSRPVQLRVVDPDHARVAQAPLLHHREGGCARGDEVDVVRQEVDLGEAAQQRDAEAALRAGGRGQAGLLEVPLERSRERAKSLRKVPIGPPVWSVAHIS